MMGGDQNWLCLGAVTAVINQIKANLFSSGCEEAVGPVDRRREVVITNQRNGFSLPFPFIVDRCAEVERGSLHRFMRLRLRVRW